MYVVENRKKERRKNDLAYIECKPCRFILRNPTKVKKNWCKKVVDEGVRRVDSGTASINRSSLTCTADVVRQVASDILRRGG